MLEVQELFKILVEIYSHLPLRRERARAININFYPSELSLSTSNTMDSSSTKTQIFYSIVVFMNYFAGFTSAIWLFIIKMETNDQFVDSVEICLTPPESNV